MDIPYTNTLQVALTAGQANCLEIPAPARGALVRLVIKQVDGVVAGFSFDVLDRIGACATEEEVSSSFDDNPTVDRELHKIMGTQTVAGRVSEQFGVTFPYVNQDEQDIRKTPKSRLYLDITPAGTGSKTFDISYTCLASSSF